MGYPYYIFISPKHFLWVPTTYVFVYKYEKQHYFLVEKSALSIAVFSLITYILESVYFDIHHTTTSL